MPKSKPLHQQLAARRAELGWSLNDLGRRIEPPMAPSHVSAYLSGSKPLVSLHVAQRMAVAMECQWLLKRQIAKKNKTTPLTTPPRLI